MTSLNHPEPPCAFDLILSLIASPVCHADEEKPEKNLVMGVVLQIDRDSLLIRKPNAESNTVRLALTARTRLAYFGLRG